MAASRLKVSYGPDSPPTLAGVKNISSSGIYLVTEKRLRTGELITLTLQEEAQPESGPELQFSVHARVARQGEDGIGLSFDLPPGLDRSLWGVLVRNITLLNDPEEIAQMFHTLRSILFLCRLCHSKAEEAILLMGGQLDSDRTNTLVKIAIAAEKLLAAEPDPEQMRADPKLLANILREGSWAPDELTRELWTGLLVSSCSADAPDNSNQVFVNLLIHITPIQARILAHACELALASEPEAGSSSSGSVVLSAAEMIHLTGVHELARNATDVSYLFNLGTLKNVFNFTSYLPIDSFDVTPSSLGLALYKHCRGSREKIEPKLVEQAETSLVHFMPPPHPPLFGATPLPPLSTFEG
jgi:hypothetical protein